LLKDLELLPVRPDDFPMRWIGLTGPMGSGKSTVAAILRRLGYAVLDADKTVHLILSPGGPGEDQIIRTFGEGVRAADGKLDRRALGRLVFNDADQLEALEKIVHPLVRASVADERARLRAMGKEVAFYDVPLLFEKKMETDFDYVLVVTAPENVRRARLAKRSQMTDAEFLERSKHHLSAEEKEARASAVIQNLGDLRELEAETMRALKTLGISPPPA
jgi:dephospho-CoA kinase